MPEGLAAAVEEADLHRLQGKDEAALEIYKEVLADLGDIRDYSNPWLPIDGLRERMLSAYRHYRDAEKFEVALKLIPMLKPLVPATRLLELEAEVNRSWAERLAATAAHGDDARSQELSEQSRRRYHHAADTLYRLSKLTKDTRQYPDYLWQSADAYRQAHDYHRTSRVMRMYLDENQPQRRADALLAIGESELALNNLEAALAPLRELLRDDAKHPLSYRARLVMHDVYVEQNKFAEARRMLVENLDHEALTPRSLEWRDSLFALADMLYRQAMELEATSREQGVDGEVEEGQKAGLKTLEQAAGTFREAILKYGEALARYPDAPQAFDARYLLAECHRQAAKWPRKKMPSVSIETTRAALTRQMHDDLASAHAIYLQLINDLNARQDEQPLNVRERNLLRNSYFLLADTLFDLGKYEDAIHAYSSATNRYQQQPEALEAFVQIASCYRQLNEHAKARGTLEQAKVMLRRIPADAEFTKTTRYDRDEWAALLDLLSTM
jgi:TolA-binding protein